MATPTLNAGGARSGADAANTTTTTALLAPSAFSDGDCIYVPIASDQTTGQTFTGWTGSSALYTVFDIPATTPTATGALFRKPNIVKASEVFDSVNYDFAITLGTSERQAWFCFSVTNDGGIGAKGTDNTGNGATATIPAITTTGTNSLIVACIFADQVATPFGAATGYAKLGEVSGASAASVAVYYQTVGSIQTVAAQNVTMTSEQWRAVVFEILATADVITRPDVKPIMRAGVPIQYLRI